jgi:hypothetical protein
MLDFAELLTTLADGVKKKPHQKPATQPLPSEDAIGEVQQGLTEAQAEQQSATNQGIADEPSTKTTNEVPKIQTLGGLESVPMDESTVDWQPVANIPSGTDQPVQDNPKAQALVSDKSPLDQKIAERQAKLLEAQDAPIKPQSFWKDFGAKLIQGADAFFNGNRAPIVGWGKLKHDQAVQTAEGKLNPLLAMKKQQQEFESKQAATDLARIRPEIMQQDADTKARKVMLDAQEDAIRLRLDKEKAANWRWAQEQLDKYRNGTLKISQERLKQYQQIIDETERNNNLKNEDRDAARTTSQGNTQANIASRERMTQLRVEAADLRDKLNRAERGKRAEEANKIRLRLKGIIDEVDGFNATGEAIPN